MRFCIVDDTRTAVYVELRPDRVRLIDGRTVTLEAVVGDGEERAPEDVLVRSGGRARVDERLPGGTLFVGSELSDPPRVPPAGETRSAGIEPPQVGTNVRIGHGVG
jgi:hypothetical protein